MGLISYQVPLVNSADATEDPKVATALSALLTLVNGNIDATNMAAGTLPASMLPARAYRTAAFSPSPGGYVKIPLDTVSYDPGGVGNTSHYFGGTSGQLVSNGNKYVVAATGYYTVSAQVLLTMTAVNQQFAVAVFKNGSVVSLGGLQQSYGSSLMGLTLTDTVSATAGDYLELFINNPNSGNALSIGSPASTANYLSVRQVA